MKSHWHPPSSDTSTKVAVHFKVHKNGDVSDVGFDHMSRVTEADTAALKSLEESMPSVSPLPQGAPESVDVNFSFDYNVDSGKNGSPQQKTP